MTLGQATFVALSSAAAGTMNAVAGGGTLVTFPSLLMVGLSPVAANVTSTIAIWPGQVSSVWAYRGHLGEERRRALLMAIPALLGGIAGSLLLLVLPESSFAAVMPWLLLFACALLALQNPLKRAVASHPAGHHPAVLWTIQLLLSVYGGYFGAGMGILLLAAMGALLPIGMQHANALKVLFALLTNGVACVLFAFSGRVDFHIAALMAAASLLGGFAGAKLAQRLSPAAMRGAAIAVGLLAAGKILLRG